LLGGTNDLNDSIDGSEFADGGTFETALQNFVDQVKSRSPDTKILICKPISRQNDTAYNGDTDEIAWDELAGDRVDDVVAANGGVYMCDTYSAFGGSTPNSSYFKTGDLHLSAEGQSLLGTMIYNCLVAQDGNP
jgi:lysophospholipase L1-like esterase